MQYARPYRGKRSHIVTGFQGAYTAVCGFTPAPEYADQPGMWYPADPEPSRYYPVCKACEKRDALTAERDTLQATVVQLTKERDEAVRLIVGVATAHNEVDELLNDAQATVNSQAATIKALNHATELIIEAAVVLEQKSAPSRAPRLHALIDCYRALLDTLEQPATPDPRDQQQPGDRERRDAEEVEG